MNDSQLNTGEVRVASGDAWTEVRIDPLNGHRSLFSKRAFQPGEVISPFYWDHIQETPTYLTVQIGTGQHVELLPAHLECVNHSCSPNAFFNTTARELQCISPIEAGAEITFFYPSAEWDMDQLFDCHCQEAACIGRIAGAKYLNAAQRQHYLFTAFIQEQFRQNA